MQAGSRRKCATGASISLLNFEPVQLAGTVPQLLGRYADLVQHREIQIREGRRIPGKRDVSAAGDPARGPTGEDNRQVMLAVNSRNAEIAAVKDERVIEKRRISILYGFQLRKEVSEQ